MNILDVKYCAQDLQFEEDAHKDFEIYEVDDGIDYFENF